MERSILIEIAGAIGSLATAVTLIMAWRQIKCARELAGTNFEDGLNREYRDVISGIHVEALLDETLSEEEHAEALPDFYRYVDLSNTQAFLRQVGRVTDETWE